MYVLEHLSVNEAARIFWKTFIANSKERQRGGVICRRGSSTASEKKNLFFFFPPQIPRKSRLPDALHMHTHREPTGLKQSLKIALSAGFIGIVIGFITPLHHSAALPFAMVDEPLRPLKHGRLRDWGWGRGGMKGGWREARCLGSLLLHLLQHPRMFSTHLSSRR